MGEFFVGVARIIASGIIVLTGKIKKFFSKKKKHHNTHHKHH